MARTEAAVLNAPLTANQLAEIVRGVESSGVFTVASGVLEEEGEVKFD